MDQIVMLVKKNKKTINKQTDKQKTSVSDPVQSSECGSSRQLEEKVDHKAAARY